jgi:SnoaL-like domain
MESDTMASMVAKLADEGEIARLVLDYARGADTRNGALFASVFTEDGELEYNGRKSAGTHQLSKIPGGLNAYEKTYHTVLNTVIDLDGDTATGEVYSASHHLRPIEAGAFSDRVMYITYRDSYARTAQGWRIAKRLVDVQFIEYKPVQVSD